MLIRWSDFLFIQYSSPLILLILVIISSHIMYLSIYNTVLTKHNKLTKAKVALSKLQRNIILFGSGTEETEIEHNLEYERNGTSELKCNILIESSSQDVNEQLSKEEDQVIPNFLTEVESCILNILRYRSSSLSKQVLYKMKDWQIILSNIFL